MPHLPAYHRNPHAHKHTQQSIQGRRTAGWLEYQLVFRAATNKHHHHDWVIVNETTVFIPPLHHHHAGSAHFARFDFFCFFATVVFDVVKVLVSLFPRLRPFQRFRQLCVITSGSRPPVIRREEASAKKLLIYLWLMNRKAHKSKLLIQTIANKNIQIFIHRSYEGGAHMLELHAQTHTHTCPQSNAGKP